MLPSAKKDSVPTAQKSCVVYDFSCKCEARYVGHTTQRLADKINQMMPRAYEREVIPLVNSHFICVKSNCESTIGQHLSTNLECAKA